MSEQQALLTPEQEVEIREVMELDPVLNHLSPVEYAKAKGYLTVVEDSPQQQAPTETPVTPENTETPVIEPEVEVELEEEQDEEEEASVFQTKKGTKVSFKDESEAKGYIKDKLGIDVTTPAGYAKLVEAFNKQRTNAQKATELEKYKEDIETAFAEMPPEIVKAIEAYNNGSDWKQAIMSAPALKLDFNKDLESQDRWALIEAYAPDELTQEEFEDDPNSNQVLRLLRVAEKAFRLDKQQNDRQVAEAKRVQNERQTAFKNSALSSLEQVKADFPGIDDKELKKLEKVLTGGGLGSEFFTKDGTYRVDAARKLALIQYAPTEIERLSKKLTKLQQKNKELSDQLAGVVSRGRDTVADEKGGDSSMKSNEQSIVPDWLRSNTHKI
jgi:hypothetical protein